MRLLKLGLRFWITLTSLISFVTGWILLAHAPKPVAAASASSTSATPLPTLEPLRPLNEFQSGDDNMQSQPLFDFQPRSRQPRPFFSTGGS